MDLSMPVMDGVEATAAIVKQFPDVKVVILTSFSEQQRVMAALDAGAEGYVLKHADPEQILAAIDAVYRGGAPIDPQVARVLLDAKRLGPADHGALTDREAEVLGLVRAGLANKQIARRLDISERTVKAHLTKIFQTLGVTDRTQAALWAAEHLPTAD
jgi:DNA-binding NarL/FixJ family response regulator